MPTITNSIGTSGRDYSTIAAWITALPANLVTDGNSYVGQCYNDSEFVITSTLSFSGHTTDSTHTITLTTGPGQSFRDNASVRTNPLVYDASKGVGVRITTANALLTVSDNFVTISNLQLYKVASGSRVVNVGGSGPTNMQLLDCILQD